LATGEDNGEVIWVSLRLVLWVSLGAAMGAWFYGEPLINWLYHGQMELGSVKEVRALRCCAHRCIRRRF
jgi:O-antigen/teichoic acid export membrane protein